MLQGIGKACNTYAWFFGSGEKEERITGGTGKMFYIQERGL